MRSGWKSGDWLVIDQESGVTKYASQVAKDWKGLYVTKEWADEEQPQDFVKPLDDPIPLPFYSPPNTTFDVCNYLPVYIGLTNIPTPRTGPNAGAAAHLYDLGIGEMVIGCSFFVR
jgi:hypothetical protein